MVQFIPTSGGTAQISLDFKKGDTTESNLVSEESRDILEGVENSPLKLSLNAVTILLRRGESFVDAANGLKFTLEAVTVPDIDCMDCITTATILVEKNGQRETLEFVSGSLTGERSTAKTVFNTIVEVEKYNNSSVVLRVGR